LVGNAVSQLAPVAGALVGAAGGLVGTAQSWERDGRTMRNHSGEWDQSTVDIS